MEQLLQTLVTLFVAVGTVVLLALLWEHARPSPAWHETAVRRVKPDAAVRVRYPMRNADGDATELTIYGVAAEVRGDSLFLKGPDQTVVTADDLHGTSVEVWRRGR